MNYDKQYSYQNNHQSYQNNTYQPHQNNTYQPYQSNTYQPYQNNTYQPPAYHPGNNVELPMYETPTFNDSTRNSKALVGATSRFPPTFNCYGQWKWKQTYHLGPSSEEKQFTITFDSKLFTRKQSLFLHHGDSDKAPIIATASRSGSGWVDRATVTLHGQRGNDQDVEFTRPEGAGFRQSEVRAFHCRVNKDYVEEFQWRTSHGNEIKELAGHSSGWKLVRMSRPSPVGGRSKNPEMGFSSDGQEVVAVVAHNMSWSMTKGYKFAFMGSGLTGTLGEDFETLAAITGFWLWWQQVTKTGTTSSTVAAVSA
ncbi:uncharacterized protein CTRU02_208375 [Colletotrichum truncatum]|uniref:Uncharacterized protein n=1 Tax=Colletotrichum truncatum TaxID=5467 RepID=A0ACC3YW33_COLTU|nr:uncharacterized protein CTRU02_15728 [Colletotrichum truncatum]XP_036582395.1 uncharacterized protein CTRU02_07439 [Colletotrichum truncatum]KAF6780734.1 hypothetical protein CTRU02_15728 [Colletotrichum truncatum]KAF6791099.1 hypothetical protein CTRU02_07439 [Colletotrichum truncatum]